MIIDVHAHIFNITDVPMSAMLAFHRNEPTDDELVEALLEISRKNAPAHLHEVEMLRGERSAPDANDLYESEQDAADAFAQELATQLGGRGARGWGDPELISAALRGERGSHHREDGIAWRLIRLFFVMNSSRANIARMMLRNYEMIDGGESGQRVDLFVPMTVDYDYFFSGGALSDQDYVLDVHEEISKKAARRLLLKGHRAAIHSFAGFCPRRYAEEGAGALKRVQRAVEERGFIGVKLYPTVGYRPLNNKETISEFPKRGMSASVAAKVEKGLIALYEWCEAAEVPITTHGAPSNLGHPSFIDFSSPKRWEEVLARYPALRVNMGHFGGIDNIEWQKQIASGGRLFADVSHHDIFEGTARKNFFNELKKSGFSKLMLGTDWSMLIMDKNHKSFISDYIRYYREELGDQNLPAFLGGNAQQFLGLDTPNSKAAQRLRGWYERLGGVEIPAWLQ